MATDTAVVVVTFTDPTALAEHASWFPEHTEVLADPDRRAYQAYGLGRGSRRRVWGWRAARRYLAIGRNSGWGRLGRLRGLAGSGEDTLQLGGDMVVGPDGTLWWGYWSEGPDDRPTAAQVAAATHAP